MTTYRFGNWKYNSINCNARIFLEATPDFIPISVKLTWVLSFEYIYIYIYIALKKKTPGETTLIQTSAPGSKVQVPRTLKWNEVTFPQNWTLKNENHPHMIQHPTQNPDLCLSWCTYSKLCISRLSVELLATWGFLESWYLRWEPSW